MREDAFILSACRSPIGRFLGAFRNLSAVDLGAVTVRESLQRAGVSPGEVDEVILGNVLSAGLGQNPARQAALKAGLPVRVAALTVNKVCGSGLKAVALAAQAVRTGEAEVVVAGGMESMTGAPYLISGARAGLKAGHGLLVDSMIHDGLWDAYEDYHMGCTAEVISEKYNVSRREQDEYALESHARAVRAAREGRFSDEIVRVPVPQKRGRELWVEADEGPREETTLEALKRLAPAFREGGTVTAGNASQLSDGAAALVVASGEAARRSGGRPLARVVAFATSGVEPSLVMMAPLEAIRKVRERAGWEDAEVDLYEVNEAFAAQAVALCREVPLERNRLNVHGGSVALGHPIGASGARILTTLLFALRSRGGRKGIAALCLGGGNGVAMAVELQ